jgi:Tfp pilus assembly protein PilV
MRKTNRKSKIEIRKLPRQGFILIEVVLGVMIFAIGVLSLGRCVGNCVSAETARQQTERARLALDNRMSEIEAGEISTDKPLSDDLGEAFPGMTMKQSRTAVVAQTEKNMVITGLYEVDLEVDWQSDNQPQAKKLSFYVLRPQ